MVTRDSGPDTPMDEASFKRAMSHFASGITVVTTAEGGQRYGMTVASFASLSLRPPLVLVCIEKGVTSHDAIARSGVFGVSVLTRDQEWISAIFASRSEDRFSTIATRSGGLGVPLIEGALVQLECRVHVALPGGDHTIYVGEVVAAEIGEGEPLIYFRSSYRSIGT